MQDKVHQAHIAELMAKSLLLMIYQSESVHGAHPLQTRLVSALGEAQRAAEELAKSLRTPPAAAPVTVQPTYDFKVTEITSLNRSFRLFSATSAMWTTTATVTYDIVKDAISVVTDLSVPDHVSLSAAKAVRCVLDEEKLTDAQADAIVADLEPEATDADGIPLDPTYLIKPLNAGMHGEFFQAVAPDGATLNVAYFYAGKRFRITDAGDNVIPENDPRHGPVRRAVENHRRALDVHAA